MKSKELCGHLEPERSQINQVERPQRPIIGKGEIEKTVREEVKNEQYRVARARGLGLSENASWGEIFDLVDEQDRATMAREFDLSTYPAAKKHGLSEYPSWRTILTGVLGLHSTASVEEIIGRAREIRKGPKVGN